MSMCRRLQWPTAMESRRVEFQSLDTAVGGTYFSVYHLHCKAFIDMDSKQQRKKPRYTSFEAAMAHV